MGIFGTRASFFSDLSLILEFFVTFAFLSGYYFARKRKISPHYKTMLSAFILDVSFMVSYMVKSLVEGRTEFTGSEFVKIYVYLPTVIFHSIISIVVLILAAYTIYHGFRSTEKTNGRKMIEKEKKKHHKVGKLTILTWILSFASGLAVYYLLYVF
ncbi:protein of unknown function DUF420 [Ferroglobus placidus DSM 10642]|uniref:DUF420 domain-containing protein n=1 Tax=Ferroglobus placidus (strain DSM 10642 / AEDII12DO) TaxID=589924 RepID=D3S3J6_FERPA|nr:DUF420 domain-containing protein [Ferroglobus placidus]ADC64829.1 protein of unknown function DUF420 [Ferroglobus placidus DSM 10642]